MILLLPESQAASISLEAQLPQETKKGKYNPHKRWTAD